MNELILVDGHVHFHDCFDLGLFLEYTRNNFLRKAQDLGYAKEIAKVICFTESEGVDYFNKLKNYAVSNTKIKNWKFSLTENSNSIKINSDDNDTIIVFAGRQIVTSEKLEVLAIGLEEKINDGLPVNEVIEKVNDLNKIPVLPWGAGKWTGVRGKIIEKIILSAHNGDVFLGDNGNRPVFWSEPGLIELGRSKQIFNLPGSDPLPVKSGMKNAGKSGFILDGKLNLIKPFDDFLSKVKILNKQPKTFISLESPLMFLKNQIFMQIYKRKKKDN